MQKLLDLQSKTDRFVILGKKAICQGKSEIDAAMFEVFDEPLEKRGVPVKEAIFVMLKIRTLLVGAQCIVKFLPVC